MYQDHQVHVAFLGCTTARGKKSHSDIFQIPCCALQHVWILVDDFYENQTGVSTLPSAAGFPDRWVTDPSSTHFPLVWAAMRGRLESGGQLGSARSSSSTWACLDKLLLRQVRQEIIWFNQVFSAKKFYTHKKYILKPNLKWYLPTLNCFDKS